MVSGIKLVILGDFLFNDKTIIAFFQSFYYKKSITLCYALCETSCLFLMHVCNCNYYNKLF